MSTDTFDITGIVPEPIPDGVPNHHATSGETGEPSPIPRMSARPGRKARTPLFGRTGGASSDRATNTKPRKAAVPKLTPGAKRQIEKIYLLVGGFVQPMNEDLGTTIIESAPKCAESVYELAQQNDAFRSALHSMMQTSLSGAVIFAHLPILLALVTSYAKNERAQMTAMGVRVALKFGGAVNLDDMLATDDEQKADTASV